MSIEIDFETFLSAVDPNAYPASIQALAWTACFELSVRKQGTLWQTAVKDAGASAEAWGEALRETLYTHSLGPTLTRERAALSGQGPSIAELWAGLGAYTDWLAHALWTARASAQRLPQPWVPTQDRERLGKRMRLKHQGSDRVIELNAPRGIAYRISADGAWVLPYFTRGETVPRALALYVKAALVANYDEDVREITLVKLAAAGAFRTETVRADDLATSSRELADVLRKVLGDLAAPATPTPTSPAATRGPEPGAEVCAEHRKRGEALVEALREYGAKVRPHGDAAVGPTFIRYFLVPEKGVKVKTVTDRGDELQLRLGLDRAPMFSTAGGAVRVDVQRPDRQIVPFAGLEHRLPEADAILGNPKLLVGTSLTGELKYANLAETEACHLLVAGTTGSGKSAWLRAAIASLLLTNTPQTLQLVLVDPKRNAFNELAGSPFLKAPIVYPDDTDVAEVFAELVAEMERRYQRMSGRDSIMDYSRASGQPVPRIVCVIDEYYDLISTGKEARKAIEQEIFRLGAKARAAGIHLLIATQRPSRDTISGTLDANIPGRVALSMQKRIESQMIINESGAEHLLGHGDLLFKTLGPAQRLQGAFLDDTTRQRIFGHCGTEELAAT